MSTYRTISRNRHIDERIMAVGPIARAVWDYLCCNQQDHASGLYRLSIATACEDTGWASEQVEGALRELESESLIERDRARRLVWVRNMLHWSYPKLSGTQRTSIERHLASMPRTPLVGRLLAYYADRYAVDLNVIAQEPIADVGSDPTPDTPTSDPLAEGVQSDRIGIGPGSVSASAPARAPDPDPQGEIPGTDPPAKAARKRASLRERSGPREGNADLVAKANTVIDRINERLTWIRDRFHLEVQFFRHAPGNRRQIMRVLVEEQEPLDRLLAVIDATAREVAQKRGEGVDWLNPSTPFRPDNWPRYVGKCNGQRRVNGHGPPAMGIDSPEQALEWARAHGDDAPDGWAWTGDHRLVRAEEAAADG